MSSVSRVRRSNAGGAGGKILRCRRSPPSTPPYIRPASNREEPPSPPGGRSGGATWISGIVAGAGKLLSSFFKSGSPLASCSYSYSADGDFNEGEVDVSSKEPDPPKQQRKLEPVKDCNGTSLAIISEIDSKHAIEQLVRQETFSRDEGNKLIKIIESRVMEVSDGVLKGLEKTAHNAVASHQTWKSLNLSSKLPETMSYSSGSLNAFSSRYSAFQVLTPALRKSAVREAKKWFEDKNLASSSKHDFDCKPCTLNTKMRQYDFGVEEGSPVDVAKSYMRSSPWKSPLLRSIHFERSPSIEMHLYKDETPSAAPNYSVPSPKGLKRNHHAFGPQDTVDEIRRVRQKSTVDELDNSKFKPIDLSKRYSTDEACKISSVEAELIQHNSSKLPASESLDAPADYSVECARDYCSVGALGVPGKITEGTYPVRPDNTSSPTLISDTEEAVNAVQLTPENSSPVTLSSRLNSSLGISPHFCDHTVPISDDNQKHVEVPCQVKEQLDSLSGPCTTLIAAPKYVEHAGDHSETLLNSESKKVRPVDINSTRSVVEAGTRLDDVNASSVQLSCGVENITLHQKLTLCVKEIHYVADSPQQEG